MFIGITMLNAPVPLCWPFLEQVYLNTFSFLFIIVSMSSERLSSSPFGKKFFWLASCCMERYNRIIICPMEA